ncbi:sugar transferase [Francisella hispaniensis]|uniref:Sugar transferase n=1 Tax=Francisella hispaniensis FSC454 TaxID=1088883 RepID=A0AAC9J9L8_9GAMM|nr:sugar transferase [Francisella hispaniensis]APD50318.1 sugar transferase [Francisella hispaniensis FSC454]KYW88454.1 sugar transferase [Francisella hispaniensis FSC454]
MSSIKFNLAFTLKTIELVISVIIVLLSYFIPLHLLHYDTSNFSSFNFMVVFIAATSLLVFLIAEYTNGEKVSKSRNVLKVLLCGLAIAIIITSLAFFLRGFSFPRSLIILGFLLQLVMLSISRNLFRWLIRNTSYSKILIIGLDQEREWLFAKAATAKLPREIIAGYLSININGFSLADVAYSYKKAFISDKALKLLADNDLSILSKYNLEVVLIPRKYEISIWGAVLVPLGDSLAMSVKNFGLSYEAQIIKRIFDILFSLVVIILTSPIMLLIAVLIYLEDRNSPFFIQERVTRNAKRFNLIKFRSMKVNAEIQTGAVWAVDNDNRITKVGKIIRPIWLDELPQFFNVLKGDMSIVGPRPERPELIDKFSQEIPEFSYRTKVKAGITGYAQVLTSYATLPENKLKLDLAYIRRWNFVFDLLIIIETMRVIAMKILRLFIKTKEQTQAHFVEKKDKNYIEYIYE